MSDLIAVAYHDRVTAERARDELAQLTHVIEGAVVVGRREDGTVKLRQSVIPAGGALGGGLQEELSATGAPV
jgi:uncharacterized membrane protein